MPKTTVWSIQQIDQDTAKISVEEAAQKLKEQEVVAFPTETVYGLGADATNEAAVNKIFQAKGRPSDNPLIVHVATKQQMEEFVTHIPPLAGTLITAFMPGPLTIILPSNGKIAANVTAGLDTVGLRIPDHPVALALIQACHLPLAAPSANRSGRPSPTTAAHVLHDLDGKIAGVLDAGQTGVGVESTVVDCTGDLPMILRPGGVTRQQLEKVIGEVMVDPALAKKNEKPKSPGMKYTHYAPEAPLWLVDGSVNFIQNLINENNKEGLQVGVLASDELACQVTADVVRACGSRADLKQVAIHLYDALRSFSSTNVDIIICETFIEEGIGEAIMNRLQKAATKKLTQ
ncbi:L-threonylcarbamoyladenylate synthase [Terrihalobacillus insolitus]|uniref:L-threonylcarbamoyladenylate synthase n=1 Tax=Terrihalobacillus insolitus TaxID=2950438 RepID=UPI002341D6C7|nr:L-threonylcarbamoyladenylate synthase [Terrihalobacillus insolitus]MDC3411781.1 L-threonylcarbamoyladenylate synthase [Terrihalobacillus insolitus]